MRTAIIGVLLYFVMIAAIARLFAYDTPPCPTEHVCVFGGSL